MDNKIIIDGTEYVVLEEVNDYVYLVNPNNDEDVCIRKVILENDKKYLTNLDNEEEVDEALKLFKEKFGN